MAECRTCEKSLTTNDTNLTAMKAVEKYERKRGSVPEDVSRMARLGYDVESTDSASKVRLIEVKGYGHEGQQFALRWSQHRTAMANPTRYWFYFVYQCHSETPRVEAVQWKNAITFGLIRMTSPPSPPLGRLGNSGIG